MLRIPSRKKKAIGLSIHGFGTKGCWHHVTFLVWKSGQQGLYLRMAFLAVIWCQDLQLDQNIFLGSDTFALGTVVISSNLAVNQGKYVIALALRLSWWDIWEICTDTRTYHMVVSTTTFVVGQQSESNIHLLQHYSYILTVNDQFEKATQNKLIVLQKSVSS